MTRTAPEEEPFSALLHILKVHFHAEIFDEQQVKDLQRFYARPIEKQPDWARQFKNELRLALLGYTEDIGPDDISNATWYSQANDQDFLEWVWGQVFPEEDVPGRL